MLYLGFLQQYNIVSSAWTLCLATSCQTYSYRLKADRDKTQRGVREVSVVPVVCYGIVAAKKLMCVHAVPLCNFPLRRTFSSMQIKTVITSNIAVAIHQIE